jgi:hypothetical protein
MKMVDDNDDAEPLKRWSQDVFFVTGLKATEHIRDCYDTLLTYLNATDEVNGQLLADQALFTRTDQSVVGESE